MGQKESDFVSTKWKPQHSGKKYVSPNANQNELEPKGSVYRSHYVFGAMS